MRSRLLPLPFFVGLGLGLVALSLLGATVRSTHLIENFVRFHQLLGRETGYFPTARQVLNIVEHGIKEKPKVHVVIGGSSVVNGTGQHVTLLWTRWLQEQLGSQFRVINLAQRQDALISSGVIAAELLLGRGQPTIFVADVSYVAPLEHELAVFNYHILDAWHRNYLFSWPPRNKLLSDAKWHGSTKFRTAAWGAQLDSYLNFNDLWNFIAYEYFSLNWNPVLRILSFGPRREFNDNEPLPDQLAQFTARQLSEDVDVKMNAIRSRILSDESQWSSYVKSVDQIISPQLRAATLALTILVNPYFVKRLTPAELDAFMISVDQQTEHLRNLGFKRVIVSGRNFKNDDYVDFGHLSVSGGRKLAADVAPIIRDMAVELGYLP